MRKAERGLGVYLQIVTHFRMMNTNVFLLFFSPDKTYPKREGDSAESVAVLSSMFLGVRHSHSLSVRQS